MLKNKNKILGIIFLLIVSFAFANSVFAAEVFYNHAKSMGGTGNDQGRSVTYDSNGNSYTVGFFNGTADFDPGSGTTELTSAGSDDIFILKLDSNGDFVWVKQIGSTTSDFADNITKDGSNNLYITGRFTSTVDFDPGAGTSNLTSAGSDDIFILKLDSNGDFAWVKQIGSTGADYTESVRFDSSNNLYVTGGFAGTVDFDPGAGTSNLTSAGNVDMFVLKLNSSFEFVWAKRFGGAGWGDWIQSVSIDSSGNVYTTGSFGGSVSATDFDPGAGTQILTPNGNTDIFISKLDSNGDFVWVKQVGGTDWDSGVSTIDSSGNVYVTGDFAGTVDFDPGAGTSNLTSAGSNDSYILKLDTNGDFVWVKQIGTTGSDYGTYIATDSSGYIYAAGDFSNTFDFDFGVGTSELSLIGSIDMYILKLDSSGGFVYVKQFGGAASTVRSNEIYVNSSNGYVYTTGLVTGTVDFNPSSGTANLTSAGGNDIFVSVLAPDTTAPTITSVSTSNITNTSVTITWTTNEESSTLVEYSTDSSYSTSTAETDTSTRVTSHTVSLSNLNPCTSYQYRVKSNDSSSNLATDTNHTLEMPGCQNSSTSAGSRAYNLFAMGKTQEAKDIVTQFPNALNEIKDEDIKKELTTNSSSSNPSSTTTFTKTIKKGTVSPLVSTIQKVIGVNPDGKFGPITLKAVKEFQTKNNLKSDGIVGPKTWAVVSGLVK